MSDRAPGWPAASGSQAGRCFPAARFPIESPIMARDRKKKRAGQRRQAAATVPASPPTSASPGAEAQPDPPHWASLAMWERQPALLGIALCAMIAVSYFPALLGGFVWDDIVYVVEEPAVHAWSGLWNIWFSPADIEEEGHYWPITYTTFWLEHKLWGLAPVGFHLVNVLLYMVNVLLLWALLRRLAVPGAWAVAAVFAVHPMHVESVAWIMGRKDLLSGLFSMAAALCWIRSMEGAGGGWPDSRDPPVRGRYLSSRSSSWRWPLDLIPAPRPGLYLAALGLFAAAMLSKLVAVTLPVAFAICIWWKRGRVTWLDVSRIAPFFLVALFIAVADLSYYASRQQTDLDYGFAERALIAARALWFYVGKLVWPTDLAVVYPMWDIDAVDPLAWSYLVAAVAAAALLWYGRHRLGRGPVAGALFFAVTLSPVLGFVYYNYMLYAFVADRYAYLAGIGVISIVIGAAVHGAGKLPNLLKVGATGVFVALLAIFGRLTWEQAGIYRDEISFYTHIVSLNPEARFVQRNLAKALNDAGRPAEALAASRIAVEQAPGSVRSHNTHGAVLLALNRCDEAEESFRRVLELNSGYKHALNNLAKTRWCQGRFVESIAWHRKALDVDAEYAAAHLGLGRTLFRLGRYKQAEESLAKAVSLRPNTLSISAFQLLADVLHEQQRYEEAIERYRGVLEMDSEYVPAHAGMGYALFRLKRYEEAVESLARSVSLQPESPEAADRHVAMGRAFLALGRTETAAEHYARALEIDPRNAIALDSLAVLRFRQERYEEVLHLYGTLIEIGEDSAQLHANLGQALYYLGRFEEALRSLDRALSQDSDLDRTGIEKMRDVLRRKRQ